MDFLKEIFKDRVTHPFYKTYAVAWFIINWKVVYSLFFISEEYIYEKYFLLRNEYLFHEFFNISGYYFWIFIIILPVFLTWLIIWKLPDLLFIKATRRNEKFRIDKKIARIEEEKRLEEDTAELISAKKENIEEAIKIDRFALENKPEIAWDIEYIAFEKSQQFKLFSQIIKSIYTHGGRIVVHGSEWSKGSEFEIDSGLLAYAHSKNLINLERGDSQVPDLISLTEKGKFFVSKYTERGDSSLWDKVML